jgi:hypothetical protein
VHETGSDQWGFFRRPALFGPAVGFLAFLGSEAIRQPGTGSPEGLIWLPLFLIIATVFAAIPYLIGALLLLAVFRMLPRALVRSAPTRMQLGAIVGALIAWPFAFVLNWIPSATVDPRFNLGSMLVGCIVAGGFCSAFFTQSTSVAPSNTSLERTRER